jgi:short subunit dehydrogenase-like uncharacterized protein
MSTKQWMIYGANGYTGQLIAREAVQQGMKPLLAGRSAAKLAPLAEQLACDYRSFSLATVTEVASQLEDVALVLHCAGPFSATSAPMVEACLASGTYYLDITGEIEVFEAIHSFSERAKAAGIVLCPGVGFDVIPTDCVAASLKTLLPDATYLALGFESLSGFSPGTAKTAIEGLGQGGRVRQDGQIISVPFAYRVRPVDFGNGEKRAVTIPWGDVATAFYTTGIPNIETYIPASSRMIDWMKPMNSLRPLLKIKLLQQVVKQLIGYRVKGPEVDKRTQTPTYIWGEVSNASGAKKVARIQVANGYDVTRYGAVAIAAKVLNTDFAGGSYTPSQLMGANFIASLPGSSEFIFT